VVDGRTDITRFDVEIVDHDEWRPSTSEGSPVEVETAYVFKFNVANAAVAERVAHNLLAQKRPETAAHRLTVNVREVYRSPKK
jgi:hypothetical protein